MLSVDVSELDGQAKSGFVEFMQAKLMVKSEQAGDVITFDDRSERTHVTAPEIRTYVKRFMHVKALKKDYRILSHDGTLKFVKLRPEQKEEEEEEQEEEKGGKEKEKEKQ